MIPNPFPGKFIVFEGIDGCGKTTQLRKAFLWLDSKDNLFRSILKFLVVKEFKEPGRNREYGVKIYADLANKSPGALHKRDPLGFQVWYARDSKVNLKEVIIPRLQAGCIVLSDRFRPSLCYGARTAEEIPLLMEMNQRIIGEDFIWPDVILIFDVTVETAVERLKQKGEILDEYENKRALLERVRANYLTFAKMYSNCHVIDGERTPEGVFNEILPFITKVIKSKPGLVV